MENNIIPQSERTKDENEVVEDLYKLETTPSVEDGFYKMRIVEFEQEESTFKDFELVKVFHPENTQVGVIDNKIVAYKDLVKPQKISIEGRKSDQKTIERNKGESIEIEFSKEAVKDQDLMVSKTSLRAGDRRLDKTEEIFEDAEKGSDINFLHLIILATFLGVSTALLIDADASGKYSIYFYEYKSNGKNKEIDVVHPRERRSEQLVRLPVEEMEDLKLSLKWTDTHKIEPLGLAKEIDADQFEKEVLECQKITELKEGKVGNGIEGDLKLTPGEGGLLYFPTGNKDGKGKKTTYFLRSRGFYYPVK